MVLMVYSFLKVTLLGALVELIWPTQFFNRRNTQSIINSRLRTYIEFLLKLRNANALVSFKLILVNSYHVLVSHKNVLQKSLTKKKSLSLQNLHKLCSFFQNEVNLLLFFLIKKTKFPHKHSVVFLFFLFLVKSHKLLSLFKLNTFELLNKPLDLINVSILPGNIFLKRYFVVNFGNTSTSFSKKLLTTPILNSSSLNKYISQNSINSVGFQFLRKNKVFNKGRYSRCRQNYRTGVYICMYLSVVCIFGLYFWFYKFSFNFTYLWWFFIAFVGAFFVPKAVKFRFYEPKRVLQSFIGVFNWSLLVIKSFFN